MHKHAQLSATTSKKLCPFTTVLPSAAVTVSPVCRNHPLHLIMAAFTRLFPPILASFLYSDCRSLVPKLDNLCVHANSLNQCIIALTETWLDASIIDHELCIPGYSVIRRDRNRCGGGILLYVRSDLPILSTSTHHSLELLFADIHLRQGNMLIGLFYCPPSAPVSIIDDLDTALSDIHPTRLRSTILLGDFNTKC